MKLFYDDGRVVGDFSSKPIKVISKPTRKKSSVANTDMCIESGSEIALFNRIRSQAGATRYLLKGEHGFTSTTRDWGTLRIKFATPDAAGGAGSGSGSVGGSGGGGGAAGSGGGAAGSGGGSGAAAAAAGGGGGGGDFAGSINYSAEITLQDEKSDEVSQILVIRKVEKNTVVSSATDPVSQLQKVALYIKGSEGSYLGFADGDVKACAASGSLKDAASGEQRDYISDGCIWTIASTDRCEYTFSDLRPVGPAALTPVEPVPVVNYTKNHGTVVEIYGADFQDCHSVWFDDVRCETNLRCPEILLCRPPPLSEFADGGRGASKEKTVSILIVRSDGVIYPTCTCYTYDVDPHVVLQMAEQDTNAANAAAAAAATAAATPLPIARSAAASDAPPEAESETSAPALDANAPLQPP